MYIFNKSSSLKQFSSTILITNPLISFKWIYVYPHKYQLVYDLYTILKNANFLIMSKKKKKFNFLDLWSRTSKIYMQHLANIEQKVVPFGLKNQNLQL